jgi:hypothetical protein
MSSFNRFTTGIAVAALLTLPASAVAQAPPSQPPATQPPATTEPQPPAAQKTPDQTSAASAEAKEHLMQAETALEGVHVDTLSARAKSQVAELKKRLNTLERAISANDQASATGTEARSPRATSGTRGKTNWGTEVAAIDKTLTLLLGPDQTTGAPAATGTTGAAKTKAETLDEPTRAKLIEVRTHITAFATAMAGGKTTPAPSTTEPGAANPPPATPTPATPPATTPPATAPPTTAPPATAPPSSTPQPTGTTGTMQAQTPATQTAQPDEQLARRHLTEARNTLSELTQLPAASQLAGETRTQVSQLISNFNELITTQAEWRASYAKVNANLTALIGPDPGAADPSGTTGAVGTTGSAANLDPAIREKLLTLRSQLTQFEKAAGGTAAAPPSANPRPEDPPPATAPPPTAPPTSTPPATPPPTTPPTSTPPATPPPTTPPTTEPQTTAPAGAQSGNAEVMRHVAAIEAILKSEDDSGGLTLTKAQLEQLRTHLAALRQSLDKK